MLRRIDVFLAVFWLVVVLSRIRLVIGSYDWEEWDYYRMLGLEAERSEKTNATSIKQGYRQQAKMWHPDKRQNQNKDEATERFRRIAEAYQVLSDPEQKAAYDQFLQSSSQAKSPSSSSATETRSFFSWETLRDPLKVFEEFFFAQDIGENHDDEQNWWHGSGSGTTTNNQWENNTTNDHHEDESWYYHPQFGQVLRVTKYLEEDTLYQDFVEEWDPYRGTWGWYPLYPQPVVLRSKSYLGPHGVLSPPAILRNGPFTAGFFENCEFQIRRGSAVLWQALDKEHVMMMMMSRNIPSQCHLTLRESQLILHINGIPVWFTPTASQDDTWQQSFRYRGSQPRFTAQLDEDGSLTIYRKNDVTMMGESHSLDLLDRFQAWIWKDPLCCYSTSPAGCHRLGRLLVRVLTLNRRLGALWQQLGQLLNRVVNWLEGIEESDDEYYL